MKPPEPHCMSYHKVKYAHTYTHTENICLKNIWPNVAPASTAFAKVREAGSVEVNTKQ